MSAMEVDVAAVIDRLASQAGELHQALAVATVRAEQAEARVVELEAALEEARDG